MGDPHRAVPVTAALCLAPAVGIEGTVPADVARPGDAPLRVGHPSGVTEVAAEVATGPDGTPHIASASVVRTSRILFRGEVFY
jgi:2-methylaconitate cis-trans-isomerase PrpF